MIDDEYEDHICFPKKKKKRNLSCESWKEVEVECFLYRE